MITNDFGIPSPTVVRFGPTASLGNATNAGATGTTDSGGTLTVNTNGTFTYTPALNFSGADRFMYIDTTGVAGLPSNDAIVFITVMPPPSVTINQAAAQADPVLAGSTVNFTVVFSQDVTGFDGTDVTVTGTAGLGAITKTVTGGPSTYNVAIAGATGSGTIIATVPAGAAQNAASDNSLASTSTDNTITFLDPPTANNDAYNVVGNVRIQPNTAQGLLSNDVINGGTITAVNGSSANVGGTGFTTANGSNIIVQADGSFTYNPGPGYDGPAETFTYTLTNGGGSGIGTATMNISGMVWFIKNGGAGLNNGRLSDPFTSIASFQGQNIGGIGKPDNNDVIFIYESTTNYTGSLTLRSGQKLIGQDASVSLESFTGVTPDAAYSMQFPVMTPAAGDAAVLTTTGGSATVINLNTGNTVRGLTVGASTSAKISGTNFGTLTLGNNISPDLILTGAGTALNLNTGNLSANSGLISVACTSSGSGIRGVSLIGVGSAGIVNFGSTTISGILGQGIYVQGSTADINFGNTSVAGGSDGISIQSNPAGTRTFGTLAISNSGATGLLHSSGGGQLTVTGATTITNPASTGLDINGLNFNPGSISFNGLTINKGSTAGVGLTVSTSNTGRTLDFGALNINTSNGSGMEISGGGTFTVSSGTINATGLGATNGAAISASGVTLNATFTSVSCNVSNATSFGVAFTGVTGTSYLGTGTLTGAGSTFLVNGGNGTITYDGTINQANAGQLVYIINTTGGTITLNGNLSYMPASGNNRGIFITNCTGTIINFNGSAKSIIPAGSGEGVFITSNTGSSINFINGGLNINTQTGRGFQASGAQTISVTGAANNISTGSGTGLEMNGITLAAGGVNFASITSTSGQVASLTTLTGIGSTTLGRINTTTFVTTALNLNNAGTVNAGDAATSTLTSNSGSGITLINTTLNLIGVGVDVINTVGTGVSASGGTVAITGGNLHITTSSGGNAFNVSSTIISLTGANNTINSTGNSALSIGSSTIAAAGIAFANISSTAATGIGLNNVTGTGNINIGGGTITSPGNPVNITGGTVSLTYSGDLARTGGATTALISISGGHTTGTITFNTGTLTATIGTGLQFDNADGTYNFDGTTSLNGDDAGIDILNGSSGTFNFASTTSITNPLGTGFTIGSNTAGSGSTCNVDYNGTITKSSFGRAIDIRNKTEGTVSFDGTVSSTGTSTGINLLNNTGATINFTNTITLNTGANAAFSATGGGTISATGSASTISTTTATALNVANTTIGASGLNFRSIASNGAANGIILAITGAGNLTISGDGGGSSNGSGGTIQNSTGKGVTLNSTGAVSLNYMNITGSGNDGIDGTNVNGFTLTRSNLTNNGNADEEHGIEFANVSGNVTISNSMIRGSFEHNLKITNTSGTINSLNISSSTFDHLSVPVSPAGGNGILITLQTSAILTNAVVDQCTFRNNFSNGILVNTENNSRIGIDNATSAATVGFKLSGSTFDDNNIAIQFGVFHASDMTVDIQGNTVINDNRRGTSGPTSTSHAIVVGSSAIALAGSSLNARIDNNIIGSNTFSGSGSSIGSGIRYTVQGLTASAALINNNTIREAPGGFGMELNFLGPQDDLGVVPVSYITVTNNNVDHRNLPFSPGTSDSPLPAIYVNGDNQAGAPAAPTVKSDIRLNTVPAVGTVCGAGGSCNFLGTWIEVYEYTGGSPGILELVDTAPANANATAQLTSTNTGTAAANAGVTLIAGPLNLPPDL